MTLTAVSLFAGVGGFDLAMQRNGIDVVATVEIDKAARGVLQHQFPGATHFEDVTKVSADEFRDAGFVPERGIITGGFPCQDLSVAGKRAGLGGSRSGLFFEIVRLLDELQPRFFVLENVPGLLSSNDGRDFGTVLRSLVELGYGVAYRILDARYFGVAQRRRRVFIVGCLGDDGRTPSEILALCEGVSGDFKTGDEEGEDVALTVGTRVRNNGRDEILVGFRASSHAGYERGVGTLRASGGDLQGGSETLVARTLTARHDSSPDGDRGFNIVPVLLTMREGRDGGGKGPLVSEDVSEDVSLTLATGNGQVLVQPFVKIVRSGARDEEGNLPAEQWAERDLAPTLNAMDNTGESRATVISFSHQNGIDIQPSIDVFPTLKVGGAGQAFQESATVRRLTPVECERLQNFPDSWTKYRLNEKCETVEQADSSRYKQMGNAVCVAVVEWIMKRLVKVEET